MRVTPTVQAPLARMSPLIQREQMIQLRQRHLAPNDVILSGPDRELTGPAVVTADVELDQSRFNSSSRLPHDEIEVVAHIESYSGCRRW